MAFNRQRTKEEFGYDLDLSIRRRTNQEFNDTNNITKKKLMVVDNCANCHTERKITLGSSRKSMLCSKCHHARPEVKLAKQNQTKEVSDDTRKKMSENQWLKNGGIPANKITIKEYKEKLHRIYKDEIILITETYKNIEEKCCFIHATCGFFSAFPNHLLRGVGGPKELSTDKRRATCLEKYGVSHVTQDRDIGLKMARASNVSTIKLHWLTNEELVCQASWEPRVVDYLNLNKINFLWQPQTFKLPNGKTYRPDLYLIETDTWVEIKGYMRKGSLEKCNYFKDIVDRFEIWDRKTLIELGILAHKL